MSIPPFFPLLVLGVRVTIVCFLYFLFLLWFCGLLGCLLKCSSIHPTIYVSGTGWTWSLSQYTLNRGTSWTEWRHRTHTCRTLALLKTTVWSYIHFELWVETHWTGDVHYNKNICAKCAFINIFEKVNNICVTVTFNNLGQWHWILLFRHHRSNISFETVNRATAPSIEKCQSVDSNIRFCSPGYVYGALFYLLWISEGIGMTGHCMSKMFQNF